MTDSFLAVIPQPMAMTGDQLREARERLGWSCYELGLALGLSGERLAVRKRVDEMETGARDVSGPISTLIEAFSAGFRPSHYNPDTDELPS